MTKAAEKRRKSLVDSLTTKLGSTLRTFENKYMSAYTEWNMLPIKLSAAKHEGLESFEDFQVKFMNKSWESVGMEQPRGSSFSSVISHNDAYRMFANKAGAKRRLSNEYLTRFEFMSEAAEGYKSKFERLVTKVADGLGDVDSYSKLSVETVRNSGHELEFLISVNDIEVHARAIFVNGTLVAPHYRFITTTRAKK